MMKTCLAAFAAIVLSLPAAAAGFIPLDRAAARTLVDPAAHKQPTVIALWSADCVHCKKNLRFLAGMARTSKQVRIITVATEPESAELASLLDATGIPGKRYAYGSDSPEAVAFALDPAWRGELPRTLLLNGKGGRKAISGTLNEADMNTHLGLGSVRP